MHLSHAAGVPAPARTLLPAGRLAQRQGKVVATHPGAGSMCPGGIQQGQGPAAAAAATGTECCFARRRRPGLPRALDPPGSAGVLGDAGMPLPACAGGDYSLQTRGVLLSPPPASAPLPAQENQKAQNRNDSAPFCTVDRRCHSCACARVHLPPRTPAPRNGTAARCEGIHTINTL
jgi:hypothetical protein